MKKILFFTLLIVGTSCNNTPSLNEDFNSKDSSQYNILKDSNNTLTDFKLFWKNFRISILELDSANLIKMATFPFLIEGQDPYHPILKIKENQFMKSIRFFLNSDRLNDYPNYFAFIKDITEVEKTQYYKKGESLQDINGIVFQKVNEQWKLIQLFTDTESLKKELEK